MARSVRSNGQNSRSTTTKYDAHHTVLDKTYGAFADLRRELADSKSAVAERTEILNAFASCTDSQRAWLLLEDYFEKLSLARKDFAGSAWWPQLLESHGQDRLEATALLFLKSKRPIPNELLPYANFEKFAQLEQAEQEQAHLRLLENWILPPEQFHIDSPRAALRIVCEVAGDEDEPGLRCLKVGVGLSRPRTGEKLKTFREIADLASRSPHERELFAHHDWEFIEWLAAQPAGASDAEWTCLKGLDLLQWLARWGQGNRLERAPGGASLRFLGGVAELVPDLTFAAEAAALTHRVQILGADTRTLDQCLFFGGQPTLVLVEDQFYLIKNPPPAMLLRRWIDEPDVPVSKLSHRLLKQLRKDRRTSTTAWDELCQIHSARPQFVFEIEDDTVRLRLLARSDLDQSLWQWNGHEWQSVPEPASPPPKPEILDDPRLEHAIQWLRRLDWFTPEPGLWIGDANQHFLNTLADVWNERPGDAEYLGNPVFQRLFLSNRRLRPKLLMQSSGIDWFSVSADWEAEGLKLTPSDLERLQSATGRFVKLPDSGWMELDWEAVQAAHEAIAELGLENLSPVAQQISASQLSQSNPNCVDAAVGTEQMTEIRKRLENFTGIRPRQIPEGVKADLRPYQKQGFDFLAHLCEMKMGGILADDMGLGKTLQTLTWLAWLHEEQGKARKPALVICPASVLHNWRREANRFTPHLKVLVLESGRKRHNLRTQIPQHDLIVTNYALLRRDLPALQKFEFGALVLDEAQFIKNPGAQVTQSVKQLRAAHRLALTGTPLENRLLDLWSIVDFVQPGCLGTQTEFQQRYEPKTEDSEWAQRTARRRLSARLRPFLLRRLKQQVAQDLPDRIEERRDCELHEEQRKLYIAELRRSREQVHQAIRDKGLAKSRIHVLAALTRLRQICCHPRLVGSDSPSGKTDTLFELLESLVSEGQKVLVFSQFVQMLKLIESECAQRGFPTYVLTGETKQRQEIVNDFQNDPNAAVFLLSLRAAGTGLNLTTASYVVLYDPWWNPAVEAQAIDRSHRIGQTRTVNAYRLIAPGTVEEKIWDLQQRKAQTISDVLGEEGFARNLTQADLDFLFSDDQVEGA